jgi:hypothetical protein
MKTYRRPLLTSALHGREWSLVSFKLRSLYPLYLFDTRLVGHQSLFVLCGEEKNLIPLPGIEPWSLIVIN